MPVLTYRVRRWPRGVGVRRPVRTGTVVAETVGGPGIAQPAAVAIGGD
jgi:hypothetical protein